MAYLKVLPVATNTHLNNLIKYITRVDKTDGRVFVSAAGCRVETVMKDFKKIREISGKQRGLVAHQLVRSFPAGEVDPEQAQQMAEELAARMLPGYQYIVCTHVDRDHIHTHIVFNSVSYLTGEKYHNNKKSLRIMRGESDNLCRKYGLSVIAPSARSGLDRRTLEAARQGGSWKVQLAITLDDLIDRVTSLPELQEELQKAGFNIERWTERDATVRKEGEEKAIRLSTLAKQFGWQYSMSALQRRLMGEEIELPEPSEPAASAEANEWRRYQAWAFEQRPASLKMKRQANLLARSVWYNKDPARAAAKALTLLALQHRDRKIGKAIGELIGRATVLRREAPLSEGQMCGNMDYRTLTGAPGKNISVRLPAAELIKLQTAEFFFAARLQKNGTADVTFKEPDIEKASVLLGISIKELLDPAVSRNAWGTQADIMEELRELAKEKRSRIWRMPVSPAEVRQLQQAGVTVAFWRKKTAVGMYDACFMEEDLLKVCTVCGKDYAAERQKRIAQDARADYARLKADAGRKGDRIIYRVVDEMLYLQLRQSKLPMVAFPKDAAYNVAFMESKLKRYEQILREASMQQEQQRRSELHNGGREN